MAKHHILIVDDDIDLVQGLGILLKDHGYETSTAFDGYEALEKVWNHEPDLIILDLMLPNLNGYQVCKILRMKEKYRSLPIVMLTGRSLEGTHPEGFQEGTDGYLTKPYEPLHLLEVIQIKLKIKQPITTT